jgi:hypothetical protein
VVRLNDAGRVELVEVDHTTPVFHNFQHGKLNTSRQFCDDFSHQLLAVRGASRIITRRQVIPV